ncbi:MAG: response regulator transcription factor [Verrucomicrobiota bacterium]
MAASRLARKYSDSTSTQPETALDPLFVKDADYWKPRLLYRKHPETLHPKGTNEFSVRIEHAGTSHYFPLGTDNESEAAHQALRIYQTVSREGWVAAGSSFPSELTLALRWLENPVAWTYTTLHTQKNRSPVRSPADQANAPGGISVAILEPDDGIRLALAKCVNCQSGFHCAMIFANAAEALREIPRHRLQLLMANDVLPDKSGPEVVEIARRFTPQIAGVIYSVYEDSDKLFSAVPGGAASYLLKRISPLHLLEPLAEMREPITPEQIAHRVRKYFQSLLTPLPAAASSLELARLTPREHEILTRLSKGGVAKEIAHTLGISLWTVHGHVKNIFEKLHVHTRTEAVVKFLQK